MTTAKSRPSLSSGKKSAKNGVIEVMAAPSPAMRNKPGKMVYFFGKSKTEGAADMKLLLGGKGANLADMTSIGLPVPPGFTITTDTCSLYYRNGQRLPHGLMNEVHKNIAIIEKDTGKKFGDNSNPLLVSVRSGAAVSMPGMMDTILNLGLTDASVVGLANSTGNPRFAYDSYRRLIQMFGDVVMGVDHDLFEEAFNKVKAKYKASTDTDVPADGMIALCDAYKAVYRRYKGEDFPQNPFKQLELAIEAVFKSWNGDRAVSYRRIAGIAGLNGTAVNVQTMVYGNMGDDSGTGVAFTRNNATGENVFFGEFLINAQGEDVVAGIRTPQSVDQMPKWNRDVYKQLLDIKSKLEKHYKDMQDIEFTIERGRLYMLQTRTGKRTGSAAVRIACDMVREKLIDEKAALLRIPAADLTQLLLPSFDPSKKKSVEVLTRGIPASPGAAFGKLAFTAHEAVERAQKGEKVLLVREFTSPEDVEGMHSAAGILTSTGGRTSHAAVVACGWGKCCVVGASELHIDAAKGTMTVKGKKFGRDDVISIDGTSGEVMVGQIATVEPRMSGDFLQVMKWADKHRRLGIRTNADTPADAQRARDFGAEGIGLTRTEHMFFEGDRIRAMREMILAESVEARVKALDKLLPFQRDDFIGIFKAMKGFPVTIRLLDPPLHEFVPHEDAQQAELAKIMGIPLAKVKQRVASLHEANPMLGHRGCRLCVTYPEILTMQVRAIVEAAIDCLRSNIKCFPEIMLPLIGTQAELAHLRALTEQTIAQVKEAEDYKPRLDIKIGTMIEIPRAAVTADEIAAKADFFSFGTNDLTQMTFGFSRDDIGTFLPDYLSRELLPADPFQTLDTTGVGQLVRMGTEKGRSVKPDLKVGICGEHGGDPKSVWFCHDAGLDYVSCSPFRVPIARLAAAQAAIRKSR
ncbi:MAG: pyruvate, phosphate dikinase [Phycisphaerales bacterium]